MNRIIIGDGVSMTCDMLEALGSELVLLGRLNGVVKVKSITVASSGCLHGTIIAEEASVLGQVVGKIEVNGLLHIGSEGSVEGVVDFQELWAEKGAQLNGDGAEKKLRPTSLQVGMDDDQGADEGARERNSPRKIAQILGREALGLSGAANSVKKSLFLVPEDREDEQQEQSTSVSASAGGPHHRGVLSTDTIISQAGSILISTEKSFTPVYGTGRFGRFGSETASPKPPVSPISSPKAALHKSHTFAGGGDGEESSGHLQIPSNGSDSADLVSPLTSPSSKKKLNLLDQYGAGLSDEDSDGDADDVEDRYQAQGSQAAKTQRRWSMGRKGAFSFRNAMSRSMSANGKSFNASAKSQDRVVMEDCREPTDSKELSRDEVRMAHFARIANTNGRRQSLAKHF